MTEHNQEYAGFWIRVGASLIDTVLILIITVPILGAIYGESYLFGDSFIRGFWDIVFGYILPAVAIIAFWVYKSATPGKMATKLTIVDSRTGGVPTTSQYVIRYIGYYLAALPLFLGLIWVGIDKRKQGWHDKLANTVVLRNLHQEPVNFEGLK